MACMLLLAVMETLKVRTLSATMTATMYMTYTANNCRWSYSGLHQQAAAAYVHILQYQLELHWHLTLSTVLHNFYNLFASMP
jgi:hypothetical protein